MQTGNDGKTGGLSRSITGEPIPTTKYVDNGVNPYLITSGIVFVLLAITLIAVFIKRMRKT